MTNDHPDLFPTQDPAVPDFDTWWAAYPRKQGKAMARKRWGRMTLAERRAAWECLPAWCRFWAVRGEPQFIPHGSTFLNQNRWEDEVPAMPRKTDPALNGIRQRMLNRSQG